VVADHAMGPFAPEADAEGPEILGTQLGLVIGPGHTSVVYAPDNVHEYIVYHAWDPEHTIRLMRMDRLAWGEGGPFCSGPTLEPQPAPPLPSFRNGFDGPDGAPPDPGAWQVDGGDWRQRDGELVQHDPAPRPAVARLAGRAPREDYLLEVNARLLEAGDGSARYGLYLIHGTGDLTSLTLAADGSGMLCERASQGSSLRPLGPDFRSDAYHRLLVSVKGGKVEVRVDGARVASGIEAPPGASGVGLLTRGASAAFDGISVTSLWGR
jgi:hypothetical protein